MIRIDNTFVLDKHDVESAVMQFVCACHPNVATGHTISVYGQSEVVAIAFDRNKWGIQEPKVSESRIGPTFEDGV